MTVVLVFLSFEDDHEVVTIFMLNIGKRYNVYEQYAWGADLMKSE